MPRVCTLLVGRHLALEPRGVVDVLGRGIDRGPLLDDVGEIAVVIDIVAGTGRSSTSLSQKTPDSPVSASTMNSWLRSPPIGPVSARIGIAFNPIRAKVRK